MHVPPVVNIDETDSNQELLQLQRGARERELLQAVHQLGDANEVLNERAVVVMARMGHKLVLIVVVLIIYLLTANLSRNLLV